MRNRWRMNRIGFVNFWLYDEEIFSFADGKLLLRGQNGSGKSITMQSIIPFILDGDRTPSRLDPFGSSDRRMEYYFLGEGEKEESTGYLFLELKREQTGQYRTIGIGQRAQRGKPMGFWGFVVLDGRRVGPDFSLYREVGSHKLPLTKKELKELLGQENFYTESQREYMEAVNRHVFGFANLEQYNQFIRLLIKIRAPKLSKEFKPSQIYEILNDSLQTLSEEDMRAMVEAMEKMDDIQNRLDHLKQSFKDTQIIRNEYVRYNRYMLGKKAQIYLEERRRVETERGKLEQREAEKQEKSENILQLKEQCLRLAEEESLLKREREILPVNDLESAVEKLEEVKKSRLEAEAEQERLTEQLEQIREKVLRYDGEKRQIRGKMDFYREEAEKRAEELDEENELLKLELHRGLRESLADPDWREKLLALDVSVRELEQAVRTALQALEEYRQRQKAWDQEEERLLECASWRDHFKGQCREAEGLENECRDRMIEQFYLLQSENQELELSKEALSEISKGLQVYAEPGDEGEIREIFYRSWQNRNETLEERKSELAFQKKAFEERQRELEEERRAIEEMETPLPPRSQRTMEARVRLSEAGISFLPFYEAVEFSEQLPQKERDRIEAQLWDAGFLDALLVETEDAPRAWELLKDLSDVLICPEKEGGEPFPHLIPAEIGEPMKQEAARVLRHMGEREREAYDFVLAADGYFRNGMLKGYSRAEEEASYVGALARARKKERLLQENQEKLSENQEKLSETVRKWEGISERIRRLKEERERFPSFDELNRAIDLLRENRRELAAKEALWREQEERTLLAKGECRRAEQQVICSCKPLPYPRKTEAYEEVRESAYAYREGLRSLEKALTQAEHEKENFAHIQELIFREEDARENSERYLRRTRTQLAEASLQLEKLKAFLNDPKNQERAKRLVELTNRLEEIRREEQEAKARYAVLEDNVMKLEQEILQWKGIVTERMEQEARVRKYFEEERALELVMKREGNTVYEAALLAESLIRENDRTRSGVEMTTALMKTFSEHLGSLSGYGTAMEKCFQDEDGLLLRSRQRIYSIWNGQKLYLEEFYTVLKEAIESTELLIQQKDRELFEGILADTLSRKLSGRIRESRSWIQDMSVLMKSLDTSMALSFSLDWKPRAAEGEQELDTRELEKILAREKELLTDEDIEKVSLHFRNKIKMAKQAAEEKGETVNYLDLVSQALEWLNGHERVRLAVLGTEVTRNPHAFDRDTFAGKLLLKALAQIQKKPEGKNAEELLMLWYDAGIRPDDISSFVTVFGIRLYTDEGEHPAYREFRKCGESCVVTLSNLAGIKGADAPCKKVYVVENQTVFSQLCEDLKTREAALVCTSGQMKTAAWFLLDLLAQAGCTLCYSGDFDPEGLAIAEKVLARYPGRARPWCMEAEDYLYSLSKERISDRRLSGLQKLRSPRLEAVKEELYKRKLVGYQEQLLGKMKAQILADGDR